MIVLQPLPDGMATYVVFPKDYSIKSFINFIEANTAVRHVVSPLREGNYWWHKNHKLVQAYGLEIVTDYTVDSSLVMDYCKLFEEEYCYAEDYFIDR